MLMFMCIYVCLCESVFVCVCVHMYVCVYMVSHEPYLRYTAILQYPSIHHIIIIECAVTFL